MLLDSSNSSGTDRGGGVWSGRASQAPIKAISYSGHTRIELQAAAVRGLGCCWASGVWPCAPALRSVRLRELRVLLHTPRETGWLSRFGVCAKVSPRIEPVHAPLRAERAGRRCRAPAGAGGRVVRRRPRRRSPSQSFWGWACDPGENTPKARKVAKSY